MPSCFKIRRRYTVGRASLTFVLTFALSLVLTGSVLGQAGETIQYFPHYALGGGWITSFDIHNPTGADITVKVELFSSDGTPFASKEVIVPDGGTQTVTFDPPQNLTTGWARVTSTEDFNVSELFQFVPGGQLQSQVGVLPAVTTDEFKLFALLRSATATATGLAVANPSSQVESVMTVKRLSMSGQLLDSKEVRVAPQSHFAVFLNQDPFFNGLDNFEGLVEVSATQPVAAVTLRLDGPIVATVPIIAPPANNFTDITATSIHLPATTDNNTGILTLGGQRFLHAFPGNNTFLGQGTGNFSMTGLRNTATGIVVLQSNTTGNDNTGNGYAALATNTTGDNNTALGFAALNANTTGDLNTASGFRSLQSNTTGNGNTATGAESLGSNTTGGFNTAIGLRVLQSNTTGIANTATGAEALVSNTAGSNNTATGSDALRSNSTGSRNTAFGKDALFTNTTGVDNTATGASALLSNTTGSLNTATGSSALSSNTTGVNNTATGRGALTANTTGPFNTATGDFALGGNTTGNSNTAVGLAALVSSTIGDGNTAIGVSALSGNVTGSSNTAVGSTANVAFSNLTNATAIGAGAIVTQSNKIRLGSSSVTVLESQVGLTVVSDRNAKEGFRSIDAEDVLEKLAQVPVTSWNHIGHDPEQDRHYGPMAQDFFAAFGNDGVGKVGSETRINSSDLSGILMLAVQALEKRTSDVEALKKKVSDLQARLEASERSKAHR
jgi:hypothetical protein